MIINNLFRRIVSLFDLLFPKSVGIRIKIFRLVRDFFVPQIIKNNQIVNFKAKEKHVFFGYYDVSPFDNNGILLLATQAPDVDKSPKENDFAEIGFYNIDKPEKGFISLGKTNTWCWQQGCRLQWYGEENKHVIYNCLVDGKYGSVIKEIYSGKTIKEIRKPLYSISKDGKWGLSLDFSRLQRLRPGYGYSTLKDESRGELVPQRGIDLVNIESGEWRQLFSLSDIAKIESHKSMDGAEHYFNHLMFNPSGNKFIFYHLWNKKGKKFSRIFISNLDGSGIKLLNNSGKSSHYNWISDDKIILYSYIEEIKKYSFAIFNLEGRKEYFGKNISKDDGHPTYIESKLAILLDTYPDLFKQRSLLYYNFKKDQTEIIARFDDFDNFTKEFRCDLHPRINNKANRICIDRIINGKRAISIFDFNFNDNYNV